MTPKGSKLALFLPDLSGGGAERMIVNLANALAARGHEVDLVLCRQQGVYGDIVSPEVRVVDLGARHPMLSLPALCRYLKSSRRDAMMSALNQPNVIAALAKRITKTRTRIVLSIRNTLTLEAKHAESLKMRMMPTLVKRTAKWADAIVAVSRGAAEDAANLIGLSKEQVQVIYNPVVDEALLQSAKDRPNHPFFSEGAPPVVLAVGRLTAQKDYPTLLRAFAKVATTTDVRLLILGEGDERAKLEELARELRISDRIDMPGFVSKPFGYMGHCGVFVLSSLFEGLPGVLIQALASGAPLVSTDCPSGPREVLQDGRWGRLVPVGDVDTLAEAMLATLTEPRPGDRPEAWQPFAVDVTTDAYERLLLGTAPR